MTEQTLILASGQPAATLDAILAGIGPDQSLSCRFDERLQKWSCEVWGTSARWTADLYGTGYTLAGAIADLHPPQHIKRARPADPGEWTTEEVLP